MPLLALVMVQVLTCTATPGVSVLAVLRQYRAAGWSLVALTSERPQPLACLAQIPLPAESLPCIEPTKIVLKRLYNVEGFGETWRDKDLTPAPRGCVLTEETAP